MNDFGYGFFSGAVTAALPLIGFMLDSASKRKDAEQAANLRDRMKTAEVRDVLDSALHILHHGNRIEPGSHWHDTAKQAIRGVTFTQLSLPSKDASFLESRSFEVTGVDFELNPRLATGLSPRALCGQAAHHGECPSPSIARAAEVDTSMLFSARMQVCKALGIPVSTTEQIVAEVERLRLAGATVRVPWGTWEPGGAWQHNPALSISAIEQRAQNEAAGYVCPGTDGIGDTVVMVRDEATGEYAWRLVPKNAAGVSSTPGQTKTPSDAEGLLHGPRPPASD